MGVCREVTYSDNDDDDMTRTRAYARSIESAAAATPTVVILLERPSLHSTLNRAKVLLARHKVVARAVERSVVDAAERRLDDVVAGAIHLEADARNHQ